MDVLCKFPAKLVPLAFQEVIREFGLGHLADQSMLESPAASRTNDANRMLITSGISTEGSEIAFLWDSSPGAEHFRAFQILWENVRKMRSGEASHIAVVNRMNQSRVTQPGSGPDGRRPLKLYPDIEDFTLYNTDLRGAKVEETRNHFVDIEARRQAQKAKDEANYEESLPDRADDQLIKLERMGLVPAGGPCSHAVSSGIDMEPSNAAAQ